MSFLQNPYQCVEVENAGLIKRASLDLGAITFIYGPNGSGKSTLLRGLKEFGSVIQNFINGVKTNKNSYFKEYAHKNKDLSFGLVYGSEKTHINRLLGDSLNWASEAIDSPNLSALHKFIKVKDNQLSVKVIKFSELDSVSIALFRDNDLLLIINPRANTIMTGEEIEIQNKSFPINQTLKYGGSIAQSVSQKTNGIFLKYTGDKFSDNDESNNNTIKEFEHLLSVQLNLVLHSRQITYVEPLRPILQNTDIFTLNDERVPFNCDEQAIRITNSWMMDPDKFNLQQRIVDVNYISEVPSMAVERSVDTLYRKFFIYDEKLQKNLPFDKVGTGLSQVIPILTSLFSTGDSLLLIEQPEIHLHPAMQAILMDAILEAAFENGKQIILETHSETFLLRALRRIREGKFPKHMQPFGGALKRLDRYLKDEPEPVDNRDIDSIMVYYFDNKDMQSYPGATNVKNMRLDSQGRLIDDWPGGFFEEGVREVLI